MLPPSARAAVIHTATAGTADGLHGVLLAAPAFAAVGAGADLAFVRDPVPDERHHWAVLRTSSRPDTRPFDFFADF